ncbi:hypothetical protein F511_19080 [Dorcoceras hygrometricum]|uniref:Uncharacterized protein n=1 Tax=Dorcoceras hygrometricum TaxID=472368 RepID=A0A2Z7D0E0_9LAMI|nr:hypothetical protein F511_19080 [Dorcoceras hygrometricum]
MENIVEFKFDKISDLGDLSFRGNERSEIISAESTEYITLISGSLSFVTLSAMASSLVSNTNQVHFASVLAMDNSEMIAMFEALVASGLNGFLGCMSDIFESSLIEFYQNASVRDDKFVSTVQGKLVEISEEVFSRTFQLPVKGLIDIHEVSKDLIFDARTEFSLNGEQLTTSCKKRELKIEYMLLSDIVANRLRLRRLAFLTSLNKDIAAKEENVLTWAETDSVQVALQRKVYILAKYRESLLRKFLESRKANICSGQPRSVMALRIIELLSDAHSTSVKHFLMQRQAHGLQCTNPCCSMLSEDVLYCGFYIPRNHKIFVSTCWLRLLRRIGDVWVVEDGYDRWVYEDKTPVSQLLYSMFGCLRPVGSSNVCTDIIPTGPVLGDFSIPRRFVDNVSYRIQKLDSALPFFSAQISPVVDISSSPKDFVPSYPNQSSSSASSMHLTDDIPQGTTTAVGSTPDVAQFSLPFAVSDSFNDLRTSMSRIISLQSKESRRLDDSHKEVLDKIKQLEKTILDSFYQQNQVFHRLITGIRQEAHNDTNVLSHGLKVVRTQTAILTTDQEDANKEAKEQKAIIKDMDERLATLRREQLDFRAQAQENYNNLSSQLGELVAYINRGNDKKGEESSSRRPQPPPDDQNRPTGGNARRGGGGGGSGGSGRRDDRKGPSTKRGSGRSGAGGPYKKNAEWWLYG